MVLRMTFDLYPMRPVRIFRQNGTFLPHYQNSADVQFEVSKGIEGNNQKGDAF